jgi:xanthine dehydrogenase YagS FAD-binding subunit
MNRFSYTRAATVDETVSAFEQQPDSKFLAGGTNLIDLMKMGVEQPQHLIDVTRLPLTQIEERNGGVRIGALVSNRDLASHRLIRERYPVLSMSILAGASPQLRNLATTAGNLLQSTRCYYFYDPSYAECNKRVPGSGCAAMQGYNKIHAILGASSQCIATNPSDMNVAMMVLDAVIQVKGPRGERSLAAKDFFRLPGDTPQFNTNLQPGELIVAVDLPALDIARNSTYLKVRERNSYAFALVSAAAMIELDPNGFIKTARVALGGVAHMPWRVPEAEESMTGKKAGPDAYRAAAEIMLRGAKPYPDNAFKLEMTRRAVVRSFETIAKV